MLIEPAAVYLAGYMLVWTVRESPSHAEGVAKDFEHAVDEPTLPEEGARDVWQESFNQGEQLHIEACCVLGRTGVLRPSGGGQELALRPSACLRKAASRENCARPCLQPHHVRVDLRGSRIARHAARAHAASSCADGPTESSLCACGHPSLLADLWQSAARKGLSP